MHVWVITVGEPLPLPGQTTRLYRTGRLARALVRQGHRVTWWTSTFDHIAKEPLAAAPGVYPVEAGLQLHFLHGVSYRRNVSIRRWVNHRQIGRALRRAAPLAERPDVILSSFPTIELCLEAVRYARKARVPVLVDIRDLWPDAFWTAVPGVPRWIARLATYPLARATRTALAGSDGLVATSDGYLEWGLRQARRARGPWDQVIPLGYERPEPAPASSAAAASLLALGVDPKARIAWFVGSFGRSYDLGPVLAAARQLNLAGHGQIQFVLSGAGERERTWKAQAAGVPNVVFTGWLDRHQLGHLMATAWIGLAAYARQAPQGLPNKLFEYFAAGLPVLSSLQGEARQLLERLDCGLTYEPGDPARLVASLQRLLGDRALHARLAANARRAFEEHYAADLVDARLVAYLVAAAKGLGPRRTTPAH